VIPRARILVVNPVGTDIYDQTTLDVATMAADPSTEIIVRHLHGVSATPFIPSQELVLGPLLSAVIQGERDGFNAVVIACCSDPGLWDAKSLVRIPVTAPFEAAARTASAFGRLAVLYPGVCSGADENLPQNGNWARQLARHYGIAELIAGTFPVPVEHPSTEECSRLLASSPAALGELMIARMRAALEGEGVQLARRAVTEAEAEAIFVACTIWAGMTAPLGRAILVPVLDPLATAVRYAALLITAQQFSRLEQHANTRGAAA
jgi:Asp/Glu/hydantoin racemase